MSSSILPLIENTPDKAYFSELFQAQAPAGLKDAVIVHRDAILVDWHLEGADRVNFIFSCTKSFLSHIPQFD